MVAETDETTYFMDGILEDDIPDDENVVLRALSHPDGFFGGALCSYIKVFFSPCRKLQKLL